MTNKIAFVFPGQGSQFVGMGKDLKDQFATARQIFEQADEICKKPISKLCFEGPMDELTLTDNLQPAVTAVNLACLAALTESGVKAEISAGHSLGEYAALVSCGAISNYDSLRLVQKRGALMHREATANPGDMVALIGLDISSVNEIIDEIRGSGVLAVANHNTAEQIVITGEKELVLRAAELAKERTGRAVALKVSGAWHCDLMKGAVAEFRQFLEGITFSEPKSSMLFNATAGKESSPQKIKDIMATQLVSPVRWYDIMKGMLSDGIDTFVEVGPKNVLSGLLKKTVPADKNASIHNVQDIKSLNKFLESC
ncbi:Malonyl CoA-acyl carrier protein transacylase [uncultured Desulfobacterium sp.]|uniref:Malonyl CoA-acyl carrier protein transacylase n=1 Tax=uncultured Desulfobacterium sp. TaxID=201089 RepID=A0A445MXW4_9BACT|nr:Malonyl CoA-acyl carrier protein transacylase [uncultured Desulfobacterium sp.]